MILLPRMAMKCGRFAEPQQRGIWCIKYSITGAGPNYSGRLFYFRRFILDIIPMHGLYYHP